MSSPAGKGTVFSFVVHHAPKVPGRTLPFVIALVELEEGVRMLGELRNVDPATVEIGMPVRATYIDFPDGDSGPAWTLLRMGARSEHERADVSKWAPSCPSSRCTATRRSSCRRRSPRATTRTCTTTGTRRRPRVARTSSSTSSPTPAWCSATSPTGRDRRAIIKSIGLRLGVPWYAYDTVTFNGEVTAVEDGLITLKVVGSNSLGDHVIATATLTIEGA